MGAIDSTHIAIRKPIASERIIIIASGTTVLNVHGLLLPKQCVHADLTSSREFQQTIYRHRSRLAYICWRCAHIRKLISATKLSWISSTVWNYTDAYRSGCNWIETRSLKICRPLFWRLCVQEYTRICNHLQTQWMRSESFRYSVQK